MKTVAVKQYNYRHGFFCLVGQPDVQLSYTVEDGAKSFVIYRIEFRPVKC
jgi:hypothetical protein